MTTKGIDIIPEVKQTIQKQLTKAELHKKIEENKAIQKIMMDMEKIDDEETPDKNE